MSSKDRRRHRPRAAIVLTAIAGVALGALLATFAREAVEAATPAFRQALDIAPHQVALHAHAVQDPVDDAAVTYLPDRLHPRPDTAEDRAEPPPSF